LTVNNFIFDLYIHQRILKICITVSIKIVTVFNVENNNKCFLSSKSANYDFWRIMWHWRLE